MRIVASPRSHSPGCNKPMHISDRVRSHAYSSGSPHRIFQPDVPHNISLRILRLLWRSSTTPTPPLHPTSPSPVQTFCNEPTSAFAKRSHCLDSLPTPMSFPG